MVVREQNLQCFQCSDLALHSLNTGQKIDNQYTSIEEVVVLEDHIDKNFKKFVSFYIFQNMN